MRTLLYVSIIGLATLGCKSCEYIFIDDEPLGDQLVYFQYEYVNHAWWYQHSGWFIDSTGQVLYYSQPESWTFFDSTNSISSAELEANLMEADSLLTIIDKSELMDKTELMRVASLGSLSKPQNEMADYGTESYYGLIYDKDEDSYNYVLIQQDGDWAIENKSRAAERLYKWMKSIGN